MSVPCEVQRVARELVMALMQRTVHATVQPHRRHPDRGYLVSGVVPERFVDMSKYSQEYSLYTATCEYVERYWLRASAIPGKRLFELRHVKGGAWLSVAEHHTSWTEAVEVAKSLGLDSVWDVARAVRVPVLR